MRGTPAGTLFEAEGALWMPWGSAIVSWTHQTVRRVPLASDRHYPAPLWLLPGASRAPAPAGEIHGHAPAERRGCGGHGVASVLLNVHGDLRGLAFRKQPGYLSDRGPLSAVFDKMHNFVKLIFLRPSVLSPSASIPLLEP
jgi:hypothetical protein